MTAKKAGGGKLTRSETVTVRLDPKLRYLAELAARKQRRTLSSYIEWAIEHSLQSVNFWSGDSYSSNETIADIANTLWDVDEADRFAKLAFNNQDLLTHDEQVLWKLIRESGYFWQGHYNDSGIWCWEVNQHFLKYKKLRDCWDLLLAISAGEESLDKLPKVANSNGPTEPPNNPDMYEIDPKDDIPF